MIISAGNNENFDFATPMGVGLIEMSMKYGALSYQHHSSTLLTI